MSTPPLSPETERRLALLFQRDESRTAAATLLLHECGNNLPFCEKSDSIQMERIRFAALLSAGNLATLRQAIDLAKIDWRDLLMSAGFGSDIHAHKKWLPNPRPGDSIGGRHPG